METQTHNKLLNITTLIRELNNPQNKPGGKINTPKVFPYLELYHFGQSANNSISPSNLSRLLSSMHNKIKKMKNEPNFIHSTTLNYSNKKLTTGNFIEKVRNELESKIRRIKKPPHNRSFSDNYKGNNSIPKTRKQKVGFNELVILPAPSLPQSVKNSKLRKDSFPDCGVDFQRIDLPYAKKYISNGYFSELDYNVETKDVSINTQLHIH